MNVDTCSDVNIVDEGSFQKLQHLVKLRKANIKLFGYNSRTPLKTLGRFSEMVESRNKMTLAEFYVVAGHSGSLINADTAEALNLIKFTNNINSTDSIHQQYHDVFHGIGKMKNVRVKLHIDDKVPPIVQRCRRVPLPLREKVE